MIWLLCGSMTNNNNDLQPFGVQVSVRSPGVTTETCCHLPQELGFYGWLQKVAPSDPKYACHTPGMERTGSGEEGCACQCAQRTSCAAPPFIQARRVLELGSSSTTCTCVSNGTKYNHSQGAREPAPVAVGIEVSDCAGRRPASPRHLILETASGAESICGRPTAMLWVSPEDLVASFSASWRGHELSKGFARAPSLAHHRQVSQRNTRKRKDHPRLFSKMHFLANVMFT